MPSSLKKILPGIQIARRSERKEREREKEEFEKARENEKDVEKEREKWCIFCWKSVDC